MVELIVGAEGGESNRRHVVTTVLPVGHGKPSTLSSILGTIQESFEHLVYDSKIYYRQLLVIMRSAFM